jgi:hypothetical protein
MSGTASVPQGWHGSGQIGLGPNPASMPDRWGYRLRRLRLVHD